MVLLLLTESLLSLTLFVGGGGSVWSCSTKCPFKFCNHLDGTGRAGCFTLIVFLMSCACKCYVTFANGAIGWSAVCDCGIFFNFFLMILYIFQLFSSANYRPKNLGMNISIMSTKCIVYVQFYSIISLNDRKFTNKTGQLLS